MTSVLKIQNTTVGFVTIMNLISVSDSMSNAKALVVRRFTVGTLFDHFMLLRLSHHGYIWIDLRGINMEDLELRSAGFSNHVTFCF